MSITKGSGRTSLAEIAAQRQAEQAARDRSLYGDAQEHVALLRRRGFIVTREGAAVRVGNKLQTFDEVKAMADRENGLAVPKEGGPPVSGFKVGDKVPIAATRPARAVASKPVRSAAEPAAARKLSGAAQASVARAAQHSTDLGERPRVVWLDLGLLEVDRSYQREIVGAGQAHISRILKAFNWNCYQPIVVTERADGTYAVIDGQHRLEAAKRHPLIDSLPCYIVAAPDVAAQAAIFTAVNSRRLALTSQQVFWASHAAGDVHAVTADRLCRDLGLRILRSPPSGSIPPRAIMAPFTLIKLLRAGWQAPLKTALSLLAETHGEGANTFRSPTIVALTRLCAGATFGRARMASTLARLNLDDLYDDARRDRISGGGTIESATERVLLAHYDVRAGKR